MRGKPIALYGAGGLGRELLTLIRQINKKGPAWVVRGFFDDKLEPSQTVQAEEVLGGLDELNQWPEPLELVIAIASPQIKRQITEHITNPLIHFPTLVHPSVEIEDFQHISMGEGSIIAAGCTLTNDIVTGRHVFLNLHCTVGHDVAIGDYTSLMPGCHISGNVTIEEEVYIGTGASVINNIRLGRGTLVGAGAVVIDSTETCARVVGVPAKPQLQRRPEF